VKKHNTTFLLVLGAVIAVVTLLGYRNFITPDKNKEGRGVPCINSFLPVPDNLHIHPELEIIINGKNVIIPANIGIEPAGCHRVLHTHDTTGVIHVEPNFPQDFTLQDFMSLWGKPFSRNELLDCRGKVEMSVDGSPSTEYGSLILKDKQKIRLECTAVDEISEN